MRASEAVVACAGGTWDASLNLYDVGGGRTVTTVQVDELVFVVGQHDDFAVGRYSLDEWLGETPQDEVSVIQADDAMQALEILDLMRQDALLWQCGSCADGTRGWIYTSNRPRLGVLACSTCGRGGGVDFRHADRHAGD